MEMSGEPGRPVGQRMKDFPEEKCGRQQEPETGFQLFLTPLASERMGRYIYRLLPLLVQAGIKPFGAFSHQGGGGNGDGADGFGPVQHPLADIALPVIDGATMRMYASVFFHHGRGSSRSPIIFEAQPASGFDHRQAVMFVRQDIPGQDAEPATACLALGQGDLDYLVDTAFIVFETDNLAGNTRPGVNELAPGTAGLFWTQRIFSERCPFLCQLN